MAANDISIAIKVNPKVHQRLHDLGKTKGFSASTYAQLLFDAGFAARVGQMRGDAVSDAELDEQVKLVFALAGQGDAAAISKATGVKEVLVAKILEAWKKQGKSR